MFFKENYLHSKNYKQLTCLLYDLLAIARKNQLSYSLYRLPLQFLYQKNFRSQSEHKYFFSDSLKELQFVFSARSLQKINAADLRDSNQNKKAEADEKVNDGLRGFLFHPFNENRDERVISNNLNRSFQFLHADIVLHPFSGELWVTRDDNLQSEQLQKVKSFIDGVQKIIIPLREAMEKTNNVEKIDEDEKRKLKNVDEVFPVVFSKADKKLQSCFFYKPKNKNSFSASTGQMKYEEGVLDILEKIHEKKITKAVLSACNVISRYAVNADSVVGGGGKHDKSCLINNEIDDVAIISVFLQAMESYRFALVCLFSSVETGTWLTASPEVLATLSPHSIEDDLADFSQKKIIENDLCFRTVSLAGTQSAEALVKIEETKSLLSQVTWSEKEIAEQALVSRYIVDAFKTLRLREYEEWGPRSVFAGGAIHLASIFEVNLTKYYGLDLLIDMLCLLHPTSAVGGYPKNEALKCIAKNEEHVREHYAGVLGPYRLGLKLGLRLHSKKNREKQSDNEGNTIKSNVEREGTFYVNIRTLQVMPEKLIFYGGAGIVLGSIPEKEWQEVQLKMKVLQHFFMK